LTRRRRVRGARPAAQAQALGLGLGLALAMLVALAMAPACGGDPMVLGGDPDLLWWTDHETGDMADWMAGGADAGGPWQQNGGTLMFVSSPVRSGRYAMRSTVATAGLGTAQAAAIVTRLNAPAEGAYYSAWFFVPAAVYPPSYWVFFKFRSRHDPTDGATATEAWDVNFTPDQNGEMRLRLYGHEASMDEAPIATAAVPLFRWFQVEAYFRAASDTTGRLTLWQDGVMLFDVSGRRTTPSAYVEWNVGSVTSGQLTPPTVDVVIEDAAISRRRLGPEYPVFSRGQ
jgi:hypothetical protein